MIPEPGLHAYEVWLNHVYKAWSRFRGLHALFCPHLKLRSLKFSRIVNRPMFSFLSILAYTTQLFPAGFGNVRFAAAECWSSLDLTVVIDLMCEMRGFNER
jgi:hypothetical protein